MQWTVYMYWWTSGLVATLTINASWGYAAMVRVPPNARIFPLLFFQRVVRYQFYFNWVFEIYSLCHGKKKLCLISAQKFMQLGSALVKLANYV